MRSVAVTAMVRRTAGAESAATAWVVVARARAPRTAPIPASDPDPAAPPAEVRAAAPATTGCRPARTGRRTVGRGTRVRNRSGRGPAEQVADTRRLGHRAGDRQVVGVGREADARVGPPVHSGSETGVGDELTHRPVVFDSRAANRSPACRRVRPWRRRRAGSADSGTGRHRGKQVARRQGGVQDERSPIAAGRFVTAVVQQVLGADQQAGVVRVVLVQQVCRRLEHVDGLDQVGLTGREQADTAVGEPNCAEQQRIQRVCVLGDGDAGRAGRVQRRQNVLCRNAIGVAEVPAAPASRRERSRCAG